MPVASRAKLFVINTTTDEEQQRNTAQVNTIGNPRAAASLSPKRAKLPAVNKGNKGVMLIVVKLCEIGNRHGRSGLPEMKIPYPVA